MTPASPERWRVVAERLCHMVGRVHERGWCLGTSGNFSAVVERDPLTLLVTGSGLDKAALGPADLVAVGADGAPVPGQRGRPSAETRVHVTVAERTGAAAVLHTHSVAGTLVSEHYAPRAGLALRGYEMLKGLRGVTTHEAEIFLSIVPNTQDMGALSDEVRKVLGARDGVLGFLIAGHGLYAWGNTMDEALRHVEIFEFLLECVARRTRFELLGG